MYVEVVAEAVAFADAAVGCAQVILHPGVAAGVSAYGIVVDVVQELGTHHVIDGLVVHTHVGAHLKAALQLVEAVDVPVDGRAEVHGQLVVVACQHVVGSIAAHGIHLRIGIVELIPLHLTVGARCPPVVIALLPGVEVVVGTVGETPHVVVV